MGAFKAYDFRGIFGKDFDLETIYKFGFFLLSLLNSKKVLIGRDMRLTSDEMFDALAKGITDAGCDVYNMGLSTTPMVYYFTAKHKFDASVMITASHNPKEYNGLKVSKTDALPVGFDNGLGELEQKILNQEIVITKNKGKIFDYPLKQEYLDFQKKYHYNTDNLKVVIDCSNGMASILVKDIFGDNPIYIYDNLDGNFPNHEANPLDLKNVRDLQKKVLDTKSDIGIIFDGDADRVMFVDENGSFIPPDLMIAVFGHYFAEEKNAPGLILQDIRTSKSVEEYLNSMNREVYIWRVGRAYAAMKLREIDGAYGGEYAGHYYFRDFFYSDSAMIAAQIALHIFSDIKKRGITVSQLIADIKRYANSGEINFTINEKQAAMEAVKNKTTSYEKPTRILDFDGYRIEFQDWWFNIRPSNTEPYLRLLMEAKNEEMLALKRSLIEDILAPFIVNSLK